MYYTGCTYNSGTAWNWVGFSGTNTGFGTHSNEESNRIAILPSGNSIMQMSFDGGTSIHGHIYPGDSLTFDGVLRSGCSFRAQSASQKIRMWAW